VKRDDWASLVLIALNILVFAVAAAGGVSTFDPSSEQLLRWGADYGPLTTSGQWWRVATSMFLHGGIIHLLLNMWCLWNLGPIAERWFGRTPFLILYFLSGIGGSLASLYMHPATVSVGASGAIFGLAGGLIALLGLRRDAAAAAPVKRFLPSLFTFVAYNLFYGSVTPGIDNAAHVGGLIVGAGFSLALFVGPGRLALTTAVFAAALLVGAATLPRTTLVEVGRLYAELGQPDQALRTLQRATAAHPEDADAWRLLGTVQLSERRWTEAIAAFDRLALLAPADSTVRYDLAYSYLARGQSRVETGDRAGAERDFAHVVDMQADTALTAAARRALRP
jgi:rhomboid protease GluP